MSRTIAIFVYESVVGNGDAEIKKLASLLVIGSVSKDMTIDELRPWQDRMVVLYLHDGEITTAKIDFVDAEYDYIIVSVMTSNREYVQPEKNAFTIRAADIQRIDPA